MKTGITIIGIVAILAVIGVFAQPGETNTVSAPPVSVIAPQPAATAQVAALVMEIVAKAKAGDTAYFAPKIDGYSLELATELATGTGTNPVTKIRGSYHRGAEADLVAMIRRSGMATNFLGRCFIRADGTGRLSYHTRDPRCHFQVDLVKTNSAWTIKRFWFCR